MKNPFGHSFKGMLQEIQISDANDRFLHKKTFRMSKIYPIYTK